MANIPRQIDKCSMTEDAQTIDRLKVIARNWGGDVIYKPLEWFEVIRLKGYFPCTFADSVIQWEEKKIFYNNDKTRIWADLIHEMAHTFAMKTDPNNSNEFDFFGWELQLVKFLGLNFDGWISTLNNYQTEFGDFTHLTYAQQQQFYTEAYRRGVRYGNLRVRESDLFLLPCSVRQKNNEIGLALYDPLPA